tara:strand:+ start:296 stop:934 length:639 start_codon:yes stop_codon:yes gene_type:complete
MNDFSTFILILICITVFYVYLENKSSEVTYVNYGSVEYLVRNLPDKEKAAELLSKVRGNCETLVNHLSSDIKKNHKKYTKQNITDIKRLDKNFRPDNISESNPGNNYTSYSINKGEKIVFCIRHKHTEIKGELVDINTIMFVAIHELAHLMTKSIGHTPEFWDNMRFLLKHGIDLGVYKYVNYNEHKEKYCGILITSTPLDISQLSDSNKKK